ncbi:MAG: phage tail tape measure protein, partial [Kofleriaceae bacterium]
MSENRANIEITATSNRLNSGLRAAATKMGRWEAEIMQTSKRSGSATAAAFAGNFAANLASRGLDIAADQARAALDFDRQLVDLQIATGKTRGEMSAIADAARAVSSAVGLSSAEVLAGAQRYVAITGDVDGATTAMSSFARIARAAGAPVEDVSKAAAALRDNLNLDPSQFEAAFGGLIAQGKAGSVEVKDLAAELASLAPQFAQFKGAGGLGSVGELGAAFQIAKKGFGDANTAATGLKSMMTALTQNADRFAKAGIRVYDKDPKTGVKTLRNFSEIWADINKSKLVNDPTALGKAFGREEATRTFRMFQQYPALFEQLIAAGKEFGTVQQDL